MKMPTQNSMLINSFSLIVPVTAVCPKQSPCGLYSFIQSGLSQYGDSYHHYSMLKSSKYNETSLAKPYRNNNRQNTTVSNTNTQG